VPAELLGEWLQQQAAAAQTMDQPSGRAA